MEKPFFALIGLHGNPVMAMCLEALLEVRGYTVIEHAKTPEEMLAKSAQRTDSTYIMDVNLGPPESYDFSCAHQIYESIKPKVDAGEVKFFAISAMKSIVGEAKQKGIPAITKYEFDDLCDGGVLGEIIVRG